MIKQKGQSLVELLVVIGLSALIIPSFLTGLISSRSGKAQQLQKDQATIHFKETEEIIRHIKDSNWSKITPLDNSFVHINKSGNDWVLSAGTTNINDFTQGIQFSPVFRDIGGSILSTGTSDQIDPSTVKALTTISWNQPINTSLTSTTYLTHYLDSQIKNETTDTQFNNGEKVGIGVTNALGGEINLGLEVQSKAKWCSPSFVTDLGGSEVTITLPDGPPVAVDAMADPSNVNNPNDVFVAVAPTTSTPIKLAYLTVLANQTIPTTTLKGTFTLDNSKYTSGSYPSILGGLTNDFKTNDVKYYKSPSGKTYALLATNLAAHEVVAVLVKDENGNDVYQDSVNKIYKYQTFFNTKIYNSVIITNPDTFNSPTADAAVTDKAGDNNGYQTNSANAYINDGIFAVDTNSGTSTSTNCTSNKKDKHQYYNYGFSIPSGTTINGIEVNLVVKVDSTTGSPKICVQLSWDGGNNWTTTKSTATLSTNSNSYIIGTSADNWGRTWSNTDFNNNNFRVRIIDVASDMNRDFSLDYVGVKVHYNSSSSGSNDQSPFGYGGVSLTISGNRGYVVSGGYLYVFDLSNIDSKTTTSGLDMLGCRIELDGYDCLPGSGIDRKYNSGQTGTSWSDTTGPAHNDCSDGGNIELYADNDIYPIQIGSDTYIFVAVGAGVNPELDIVNVTNIPNSSSSPTISSNSCGRSSSGNNGWKKIGSLDFNSDYGTEEAANSVFVNSTGTRAYISSNGGSDSDQLYIIDTSNKSAPHFLSGTPSTGAQSGYYLGTGANGQLYPRRSLTVLNGQRAILVGKDGFYDGNNAQEYQVLNTENESTPTYCSGVNFDAGFNDLTSVSEADGDNFVYMVANTMEKQLKIIQGGPDDTGKYTPNGIFTSQVMNLGKSVAINRFYFTASTPTNTSIEFQVAAADPVSGSCSNNNSDYTFIGPDLTNSTKFSVNSPMPLSNDNNGYENPAQCFKYRAFLSTSDTNITPILYDFNINYSP